MRILLLLALLALLAFPVRAGVYPVTTCAQLGDLALVTRALAVDKLPQQQIAVMLSRIYDADFPSLYAMAGHALASDLSALAFAKDWLGKCQGEVRPQSFKERST